MSVVFKGGTSGNRKDGLPPASPSFDKQPVVDTATRGKVTEVKFQRGDTTHPFDALTPDFMPTGGTNTTEITNVGSSKPLEQIKGQMP